MARTAIRSVLVGELHPGTDATVRVDGDPGEVPILAICTAAGEWLISPANLPTDVDLAFADALVAAAAQWRQRLRAMTD